MATQARPSVATKACLENAVFELVAALVPRLDDDDEEDDEELVDDEGAAVAVAVEALEAAVVPVDVAALEAEASVAVGSRAEKATDWVAAVPFAGLTKMMSV